MAAARRSIRARVLPFRCPHAVAGDDIDHVLVAEPPEAAFAGSTEPNPFLRYRMLLSPYRLARGAGLVRRGLGRDRRSNWTQR